MSAATAPLPSIEPKAREASCCPRCAAKGRRVGSLTMSALLCSEAARRFAAGADFHFCKTRKCEVVYFDRQNGSLFTTDDLDTKVFQKSPDPQRLVCYCFAHTVADVLQEIARSGSSGITDDVAHKCRSGRARCERMNPQGSCCLGNLRKLASTVTARASSVGTTLMTSNTETQSCCTPGENDEQ